MVDAHKIGMYFFLLGVLIAIFSGTFAVFEEMVVLKLLFLIITGVFVGLLNIDREQELGFLLATGVFIIASRAIDDYLASFAILSNFEQMIFNLIIFISSAALIVALKIIFEYSSQGDRHLEKRKELHGVFYTQSSTTWNMIVFGAVALALVLFILELFFKVASRHEMIFLFLTVLVEVVFVVDLVFLYRKSKDWPHFFRTSWLDIIAILPLGSVFALAKTARFVKIVRILSKSGRATRLAGVSHSMKFFSDKSDFNEVLKKK
ncbi:MAG: hypothetical protein H6502_00785 [Candidatus Woesearchaeota archaeon]|nr:MAG: hypothetical protein H6502_00785 [Candidatus Woesearchaeota archaeon]